MIERAPVARSRVREGKATGFRRSDRMPARDELQFANTVMATTLDASPDSILVVDENSRIISFNRRFADMWCIPTEALKAGDDGPVLSAVTALMKDPEAFVARVRYLYDHPEEVASEELETSDGRIIERHTAVMRTADGRYLGRVWFFRDITARKHAEAESRRIARQDLLTELANRRVFIESVSQAIARTERGERGFAVLYLDLDHFKDVNDTLGHPAGDMLLREVANRLRVCVRDTDLVARFGGDEFAVMAAVVDDPAGAEKLAAKLVSAVSHPFTIAATEIRCGVSIGIAICEAGAADPELLLSRADVALYQAKANGRGGFRVFTNAMDTDFRNRVAVTTELHGALSANEFFLEYQPLIDGESGRIVSAEALVRWRHPRRGVLAPAEFIPIAEGTDLIVRIDEWVRREATRQARAWLDAGLPALAISVNVSAAQFKRPLEFEKSIDDVLRRSRLPASCLEIELTETELMVASDEHNAVLGRLRERGVKVTIDDFGIGYSSLDYLRRFPVDGIKIAREFVAQIVVDESAAAIVRAIVALARELGITAVAEGIETAQQLALLKGWGCQRMQGFYFSRPLAPRDLAALLDRGVAGPAAPAALSAA